MRRWIGVLIVLVELALAGAADARVGGGQSYGGGGGSRSSGGGGGGGGDIFWLIEVLVRLVFYEPAVGVPLVITILVVLAWVVSHQGPLQYSSSAAPPPEALENASPGDIAALQQTDPNFSQTLFMDFVQLIYVRFHMERAGRQGTDDAAAQEGAAQGGLSKLAPYFAPAVLLDAEQDCRRRGIVKVSDVLIGSAHIAHIEGLDSDTVRVDVAFEANFTEAVATQVLPPLYITERWTLSRKRGVLSKGPGDITALTCPSCGSPAEMRPDGTCPYCGRVVNQGDFQWVVTATRVTSSAPRPPIDLVGGGLFTRGVEAGTEFPTVYQPTFEASRRAFSARNPNFSWPDFETRVQQIFVDLQAAWTAKQWLKARSYETDSLFNMHRYWMDMYQRQGLTNRLEDVSVSRVEPCKVAQDAFYDIITVRIFASMRDFTVNAEGTPVAGDPRNPRPFSEYWTFIRRSTSQGPSGTKTEGTCPNCGAPLQVNMAGECAYCNSKVTSGDFDWVLSSIEQDEAYRG